MDVFLVHLFLELKISRTQNQRSKAIAEAVLLFYFCIQLPNSCFFEANELHGDFISSMLQGLDRKNSFLWECRWKGVLFNPPTSDPPTTDQPSTDHLSTDLTTHQPSNPIMNDLVTKYYLKNLTIEKCSFYRIHNSWENKKLYFHLFNIYLNRIKVFITLTDTWELTMFVSKH